MRNIKVSTGFFKAAELLDKHGWCRRTAQDSRGRLCMLGALNRAWGIDAENINNLVVPAYNRFVEQFVVKASFADKTRSEELWADWNDNTARDKRQVQRQLRKIGRIALKMGV